MGLPINRIANVTLNASGNGSCFIMVPNGVRYRITATTVSTNAVLPPPGTGTSTPPPRCTIYKGVNPSPSAFLEGTYDGNRDSSNTAWELGSGEALCAEWIGGTPGTVGTFLISGTQEPAR